MDRPGQGVPGESLDKVCDLVVVVEDLGQELVPEWCPGIWIEVDRDKLGMELGWIVGPKFAGSEVNDSVDDVEQPGVGVELVGEDRDSRLCLRELDDRTDLGSGR